MNRTKEISAEGQNVTTPVLEKMSLGELSFITALYALVILATLVGNGLILAAFAVNKRLRSLTNSLIRGLAISDILVGVVSCPCWMYIFLCHYRGVVYTYEFYQFYITADIFIGSASILQLTSISIERCHAIARPLEHRVLSKKVFRALLAVPWLYAGLVASLQPVQFERWKNIYTVLMATTCFFIPFVIISIAYLCIFKKAHSKGRQYLNRHRTESNELKSEIKLSVTVATITGLFVIAWLPLFVVTIIATYYASHLPSPLGTDRLLKFVKFCHYSNSALNPVVYAFRNKEMARTFRYLFYKLICKKQSELPLEFTKSSSFRSTVGRGSSRNYASRMSDIVYKEPTTKNTSNSNNNNNNNNNNKARDIVMICSSV